MYIKKELLKNGIIEVRTYQEKILKSCLNKNTLVVLPTGLGKTIIALLIIAEKLKNSNEKILFLAPTKPLVHQHANFLKETLDIKTELIEIFTGEIPPSKRKDLWNGSRIIISTPQVIENDLLSKRINLSNNSLVIFDECHHAIGDYSYVFISEMYKKQNLNGQILGLTASPGNNSEKIIEICKNLSISNIEIRTKYDTDVRPYVHNLKFKWIGVNLPQEYIHVNQILKRALSKRLKFLKDIGAVESSSISKINKTIILDAQKKIQNAIKSELKPSKALFNAARIQSEALKIYHLIDLLQTQGKDSILNYLERLKGGLGSKIKSKSSKQIIADNDITLAFNILKNLDTIHPKINEIIKIISHQLGKNKNSKIIVFTHYRDTSKRVDEVLNQIDGVNAVRFIGQADRPNDKGLTQKDQIRIIEKFKKSEYNVLVATSVAEEGLDIPSTDLVVFYEPVPSEIRAIQRRGRTARKMPGEVIILITKGTSDEGYYWASLRKEKRMKSELELLRLNLGTIIGKEGIFNTNQSKESQTVLTDFSKDLKKIKVLVDHREYRSIVVRNLVEKGLNIEPIQLNVGDYILSSRIGVERKDVDDYLKSLTDGTLFKQVSRLRENYSRPILILEGKDLLTKRNISQTAILGSLASISIDFGVTILPTKDSIETASLISVIAKKEQDKDKKPIILRDNKKPMNLREKQRFVIEGLPNVSSVIAKRLLTHFGCIRSIANASIDELVKVEGVGKKISAEIVELLKAEYETN